MSIPAPDSFAAALLDLSLAGTILFRPLYEGAELVDFAYDYVNPAAQLQLRLPAQPNQTLRQEHPQLLETDLFRFFRQAFDTEQTSYFGTDDLGGEGATYYQLAARRYGGHLLVSFTTVTDRQRGALEVALRESRAREQAARAEAERRGQELRQAFEQAPVAIAVYHGPEFIIDLANPTVCTLWGRTAEQILGRPLFEALPEVAGQGYEELLSQVMATGNPHVAQAMPAVHERQGRRDTVYWDFVYVPVREADGRISGAMVVATEVTPQVLARQQMQQLNEELESRVQERTRALADQQRLLNQILAQVPAAITTLSGPEHRFTFANARYQQLTEGRVQVGQTVAETLPEVAEQGFIELLDNVYQRSEAFEGKEIAILLTQPGSPPVQHYLDFTYQPLPDDQGQTQGILVFAVDVTAQVRNRRQAETLQAALLAAAQQRAQERQDLLALFERAPVAVALLRAPDHQLDYYNSLFEQLFPGPQLQGRTVAEAYPPTPLTAAIIERLDYVYQTGKTYQGTERQLPTATPGPPRYVTFTYQAYYEQSQIAGVAVFVHEVTEQVRARQQQTAQQQLVEAVFEQSPTALFVLREPTYLLEVVNPLMAQLLGHPRAALLGRPYFEAVPELATQGYPELLDQVWRTGQPLVVQEQPGRLTYHQEGETGYFTFVYQPLRDTHGQVTGIACVAVDVTAQVLARQQVQALNANLATINQELHESNTQLTHTNADLDSFVYTASHDLKAPIANIEGLLLALRQDLPPEVVAAQHITRLFSLMDGAVTRFQQTLSHLTSIMQLQKGNAVPLEEVDLAALVEGVRLDLAPALEAAQAQLLVDTGSCTSFRFAPKNLRSLVFNLLSNAIKYRDPHRPPVVQLRATCTAQQTQLEVQDNGLGLGLEQQALLFKLFRRLHSHVEGSGVGLFTVKKIVENAGGTVTVQSELGVGSTFTIVLPRQAT
ncbi:MAG: PAS domain-containing protein [Janthinobacterium lividum]